MSKEKPYVLAETIGKGFAHIQHGIDRLIGWGFEKMRDVDHAEAKPSGEIMRTGRKIVAFLGKTGDAYYKAYDKLKGRK